MCFLNVCMYEYVCCKGGYCVFVLDMEYLNSEFFFVDLLDLFIESCLFFKLSL